MSGFIGICLNDGAFLSADTRRTNINTGEPFKEVIKKIYRLDSNAMIATGGLGTYGHAAREKLSDCIKKMSLNVDEIIAMAKSIFRQEYEKSLIECPNHGIPLYAIFAGYDIGINSGFIRVIRSLDMFQSVLEVTSPGQPYFTGSNTNLVQGVASKYYFEMKEKNSVLDLDLWSLSSFKEIVQLEKTIGFPIQLTMIKKENYLELFSVKSDELFLHDKEFEMNF